MIRLLHGDCLEKLKELPGDSVDSVITDPPAGISFMGKSWDSDKGGASRFFYCAKVSPSERGEGNTHPTVKPKKLMQYLIKLITPPGGTVLDPFMGSGSTGVAAREGGFAFIGIEQEEAYMQIATKRIYTRGVA